MAKMTEARFVENAWWRIDDVVTAAKKVAVTNDAVLEARDEIASNERRIAADAESGDPDAEYADSLRESIAEHRESLTKAHAERITALEETLRNAQHALALLQVRDPNPTDSMGEQPDGDEMGGVWVPGGNYV